MTRMAQQDCIAKKWKRGFDSILGKVWEDMIHAFWMVIKVMI